MIVRVEQGAVLHETSPACSAGGEVKPLKTRNRMTLYLYASSAENSNPSKVRTDLISSHPFFFSSKSFSSSYNFNRASGLRIYHKLAENSLTKGKTFIVYFDLRYQKMAAISQTKALPSKPFSRRAKWNIDSWA